MASRWIRESSRAGSLSVAEEETEEEAEEEEVVGQAEDSRGEGMEEIRSQCFHFHFYLRFPHLSPNFLCPVIG